MNEFLYIHQNLFDENQAAGCMKAHMDTNFIKNTIKSHAPEIKNQFKVEVIGIFGSYARGEQKSGSKVDVLVRFDKSATLLERVEFSDFLKEVLGIPVNVVSEKALHPKMRADVMDELVLV